MSNSKVKFRSQYNYPRLETDFEKPEGVSMTVPGMSYTVRELMHRHMVGTMPGVGHIPIWDEHPDHDSWDATIGDFDLVDAEQMALQLQERFEEIEQERKKVKKRELESINAKLKELESYKAMFDGDNKLTINDLKKKQENVLKSD